MSFLSSKYIFFKGYPKIMKPRVLILLSTYNSEKYLKEQLDSIYNQKDVDITVFASDDESTDNTIELLREYQKDHQLIIFHHPEPHNFTYNFIDAVFENKDTDFDYYAFSDQDDFWKEDKIISAITVLKENGKDVYSSNLTIVDENLAGDKLMNDDSISKCNKYNAIFENIATGCTIVFNHKFMKLMTKYYPKDIYLHDYWVYLIGVYTNSYIYDDRSFILYRQHGSNLIGDSSKKGMKTYYKKFKDSKGHQTVLCQQLLEGYRDVISEEDVKIITLMAEYRKKFSYRWKLMFGRKYKRRNHNFFKFIKVLLNKY